MRLIPRSALAAVLFLSLSTTLRADTPATTQWIVTSAHASGGGNDYVTSLRIVNPNATDALVDLYLLKASGDGSGDNSGALKVTVTVPKNSTLPIEDILFNKYGATGAGGFRIESTGTTPTAVWVLSQTLVTNAKSSTGVPGTNGFAIPAQNTDQLVAAGETAYVPYVSSSTTSSSGYRTNLFLLSANGTASTVVTVKLLKGDGTILGTTDVTLAKYGQTQINDIAKTFGYSANDTNLTATVTVKSGGPVATGASVIDNAIQSISYSPPMKVARANNGSYGLVLNDGGFEFGGTLDIINGSGDYMTMAVVVPNCAGANYVFYFQAFGASSGTNSNTSFVTQPDGSISFSGAQQDGAFNGTVFLKYDGSVFGNVNYTRATGSTGAPCPGVSLPAPYTFNGSKAASLP
jgi:hypothetical protein